MIRRRWVLLAIVCFALAFLCVTGAPALGAVIAACLLGIGAVVCLDRAGVI